MHRYCRVLALFLISYGIFYTSLSQFFPTFPARNSSMLHIPNSTDSYQVCTGDGISRCVPPLVKYTQLYRISKTHLLIACAIEKNFSTFLTAIMCYLHNPGKFLAQNRSLAADIHGTRVCKNVNEYTEAKKAGAERMKLFAVVRNPIDRFVSGFVDKCLREKTWTQFPDRCAGCEMNITCFVEKMYRRMRKFAKTPYKSINFDDSHFFPQSWRCEFSSLISKYRILKLDDAEFYDRLLDLLAEQNVSDDAMIFINKSLPHRTRHSTSDSIERKTVEMTIQSSTFLTRKLIEMYYFDFILFGYKLPVIP